MKKWFKAALFIGMAVCMFWHSENEAMAVGSMAIPGVETETTVEVPEFARFTPRTVVAENEDEMILAVHQALADQAPSVTVVFGDRMMDIPGIFQRLLDEQITGYSQGNVAKWNCTYSNNYVTFTFAYQTTVEQELILDSVVQNFCIVTEGMTDYQKILYVHNEICKIATYDYRTSWGRDNNRSAFDILTEGKAVCSGYSLLFQRVMEGLGIECRYVMGYDEEGARHAWNIVFMDGAWYHMDVTYDDPDSGIMYWYFLVGSNQVAYPIPGYTVSPIGYFESLNCN